MSEKEGERGRKEGGEYRVLRAQSRSEDGQQEDDGEDVGEDEDGWIVNSRWGRGDGMRITMGAAYVSRVQIDEGV